MKALYLLRHAKSSWADASLPDHERPLAPRGRKATRVLARYVAEARIRPALVLCSSAVRTSETLERLGPALGSDVEVWIDDGLYGAGADELLARLRRLPPAVPSVMIVGHNPGLEVLARELIGDGDDVALAGLHAKFPTGALASVLVPGEWKGLARRTASLTAFVVPRDLT